MLPSYCRSVVQATTLAVVLVARLHAQGSPVTPDAPKGAHPVRIEMSHFAPMRDGVKLSADFYFPTDVEGRLPTVMIRTPYNKKTFRLEKGVPTWLASHGYAGTSAGSTSPTASSLPRPTTGTTATIP